MTCSSGCYSGAFSKSISNDTEVLIKRKLGVITSISHIFLPLGYRRTHQIDYQHCFELSRVIVPLKAQYYLPTKIYLPISLH